MIEKKQFLQGLNTDDAPHMVAPGELINAVNVRYATTENGAIGNIESVPGTTRVYLSPLSNENLGSAVDEPRKGLIFFNPDGIYYYSLVSNATYLVLDQSQVTGGLNLSSPINGAFIIGNLLYFNDSTNEPRRINFAAALKGNGNNLFATDYQYNYPLSYEDVTLIRKPPSFPPVIGKNYNAAFTNNFIYNESFQFAWEYIYWDGEESVFSPWSISSRLNKPSENFNFIHVSFTGEIISDTVRTIRLIARVNGKSFVARSWDKKVTADATEIANHQIQPLSFDFYYSTKGEFIDDAHANKPFDSVPINSKSMEQARDRNFLVNNTIGYDTPPSTSLALTLPPVFQGGVSSINKPLVSVQVSRLPFVWSYSAWYVYLTEVAPVGYYLVPATESRGSGSGFQPMVPAPTTGTFSSLQYRGSTLAEVYTNARKPAYPSSAGMLDPGTIFNTNTTANNFTITGMTSAQFAIFKHGNYRAGIVFYDRFLRKCAVVTNESLALHIPDQIFYNESGWNNGYPSINWTLSNTNAVIEIPDWAFYYSPVRTLNLNTRFFIAGFTDKIRYVTLDTDKAYDYDNHSISTGNTVALGIDASSLTVAGLGYTFTPNDQARLYLIGGTVLDFVVIGQDREFILLEPKDISTTIDGTTRAYFEVFTPYKTSEQEPYFEVGQMYRVVNPATLTRQYEILSGIFPADAFLVARSYKTFPYLAEAMNANDKFYKRWDTDIGRATIVTTLGKVTNGSSLVFSGTYLPGTAINGLSSFEALNQEILPLEAGPIQKIILVSKVQADGTVMLAIGIETCSIYLGEQQVSDESGGTKFLVRSERVVGTVNGLEGSSGTMHPETVQKLNGLVWWYDAFKGAIVQYAGNGLFSISDYKMSRFISRYSKKYLKDGLVSRISGGIDPSNKEYLLCLPEIGDISVDLPGDVGRKNEFDIYDGKQKTLAYKIGMDKFVTTYEFFPEHFSVIGSQLFGFKNGSMYKMNDIAAIENNFFGVQYTTRLMFVANAEPNKVKLFKSISVEGNMQPTYTLFYVEYPNIQISDLEDEFINDEGIYKAAILMDRLSPNVPVLISSPDPAIDRLLKGDELRTSVLKVMTEFTTTTKKLQLKYINIGYQISAGHNT